MCGTTLQAVCATGAEHFVQLLLENGADVNTEEAGEHGTALHAAVIADWRPTMELLLDDGAEVTAYAHAVVRGLSRTEIQDYSRKRITHILRRTFTALRSPKRREYAVASKWFKPSVNRYSANHALTSLP